LINIGKLLNRKVPIYTPPAVAKFLSQIFAITYYFLKDFAELKTFHYLSFISLFTVEIEHF
jgi:hypothetical protein